MATATIPTTAGTNGSDIQHQAISRQRWLRGTAAEQREAQPARDAALGRHGSSLTPRLLA
jgi:hypothetical protein